MTLDCLETGTTALVVATQGADAALLRAMGLREGAEVTMCRAGASCIVETGSTRLGLARCLTESIQVEVGN
ncbi:MAG: FeoA family protein [Phycisphaerales bacterium]|nr:FeoA family protein [Phycisphaerales bacterium]